MRKFISQIIAGILGLWLAVTYVSGVVLNVVPGESNFFGIPFTTNWHILILIGFVLGIINFFIKPILKVITFPLRMVTLGLFGLIINMVIIWVVDLLFLELTISGILPLFWVTIIIWGLNLVIPRFVPKRKEVIIKQ